ncbi:hypothetical protein AACH06_17125 [Ideonella sp. DXS29W]|uniref:Uncharacterized protein n=1 Tax=Ideonella lacteola TaxID=2984193 RepID=A0ABU9BRF2_9BURK
MKSFLWTFVGLAFCAPIVAGMPNGPYLAWMATGPNGNIATSAISAYFLKPKGKDEFCGEISRSPVLVIKALPKGLDASLVENGVWNGDRQAASNIQTLLKDYKLEPGPGENLDGVIAFRTIDSEWSELASLGVGSLKIRRQRIRNSRISEDLVAGFCTIIPPILRK